MNSLELGGTSVDQHGRFPESWHLPEPEENPSSESVATAYLIQMLDQPESERDLSALWMQSENGQASLVMRIPFNVDGDPLKLTVTFNGESQSIQSVFDSIASGESDVSQLRQLIGGLLIHHFPQLNVETIDIARVFSFENEVSELYKAMMEMLRIYTDSGLSIQARHVTGAVTATVLPPAEVNGITESQSPPLHNNEKTVETDLQRIDSLGKARLVIGKFNKLPYPVTIHGVQFLSANFTTGLDDWHTLTEKGYQQTQGLVPKSEDPSGKFDHLLARHFRAQFFPEQRDDIRRSQISNELSEIIRNSLNIIHAIDEKNPGRIQIAFMIPCTNQDSEGRNWGAAAALVSLPAKEAHELMEIIRSDPAKGEQFVEIAFDGLFRTVRRRPVRQVAITDADAYLAKTGITDYRKREAIMNIRRDQYEPTAVEVKPYK